MRPQGRQKNYLLGGYTSGESGKGGPNTGAPKWGGRSHGVVPRVSAALSALYKQPPAYCAKRA